jgi:replicative DNA helicase
MKPFETGYYRLDQHLDIEPTDLIVFAGRPANGYNSFAQNILLRSKGKRVCYISLTDTKEKIQAKIIEIKNKYESNITLTPILDNEIVCNEDYEIHYLERENLQVIIEFIINRKNDFDYFVIDEMCAINNQKKPLFSNDKSYFKVLKALKYLCKAIDKNIILLSALHKKVENKEGTKFKFHEYGIKEKHIDYLFVLHKPSFYGLHKDIFGNSCEDREAFIYLVKTKKETVTKLLKIKTQKSGIYLE